LFGTLTGMDPASLGANKIAARDLGIGVTDARPLKRVTSDELGCIAALPELETWAMLLAGLALVGFAAKRRQRT